VLSGSAALVDAYMAKAVGKAAWRTLSAGSRREGAALRPGQCPRRRSKRRPPIWSQFARCDAVALVPVSRNAANYQR
jgi:hypothetical protein